MSNNNLQEPKQQMDIEQKEEQQTLKKQEKKNKKVDRTLLRYEQPIYQIKRKNQTGHQFVIKKLMDRRDRPNICMPTRSPILDRMKEMMPMFQKSHQQSMEAEYRQAHQIDIQLQQVEDSSSESQNQQKQAKENEMKEQKDQVHEQKQGERQKIKSFDEVQINFLTYPYATKENQEKQSSNSLEEETNPLQPKQCSGIQEIVNELQTLE